MALQTCGLNLNHAARELQPHGTPDFPCAGYSSCHTEKPEDIIPWHWHGEVEIIYISEGTLRVRIPQTSFEVEKGDCIAINSNILHYAAAAPSCQLQSLVFDPLLVTGTKDSVYAKKYLSPLLSCPSFHGYLWKADQRIADVFSSAFHALSIETAGYEFLVREQLSRLCFLLWQEYGEEAKTGDAGLDTDSLRVREMLTFIHSHFSDAVSLKEIAETAGIGERECLRCFKRTIQLSPMQYLLKYRIMHGAELLLEHPASSISEIAAQCGFDSPSNFSKLFRRFYNCTPRDYRNGGV